MENQNIVKYLESHGWEKSWDENNWVRKDALNKEANTGISTEQALISCLAGNHLTPPNIPAPSVDKIELAKYTDVNSCETSEDLYATILSFADDDGMIQGRTRKFVALSMANNLQAYMNDDLVPPNVLTREYGIRQQAMYLKYYEKK
jgi:hypothetical protein